VVSFPASRVSTNFGKCDANRNLQPTSESREGEVDTTRQFSFPVPSIENMIEYFTLANIIFGPTYPKFRSMLTRIPRKFSLLKSTTTELAHQQHLQRIIVEAPLATVWKLHRPCRRNLIASARHQINEANYPSYLLRRLEVPFESKLRTS